MAQEHIAEIARLWDEGWQAAHIDIVPAELAKTRNYESFYERLERGLDTVRVATLNGGIAGFCMVKNDEIYQIYVAPTAQGSGVAQRLLEDGERRISKAGHKTAWLACSIGNEKAARFYEKSGWVNARTQTVDLDTSEGPFPLKIWRFEKQL